MFGGVNEADDSNSPIEGQKYDGPHLTTYQTETQMLIAKIKDGHRIDKKYEKNNYKQLLNHHSNQSLHSPRSHID